MEDLFCEVCVNEFNETANIPKSLECGHSICSSCLIQILQGSKTCPKCRLKLRKNTITDYPTNYPQLNLMKRFKNSSFNIHFKDFFETIRISFEECKKAVISKCETLVNIIDADLYEIRSTLDSDENLTLIDAQKMIVELKSDLKAVEKAFNCKSDAEINSEALAIAQSTQRKAVSFSLSNFEDGKKFLHEILLRLNKGETILATKIIDGKSKYGKITSNEESNILVHALSLSNSADVDHPTVVLFDDLTKCSGVKSCRLLAFFEYLIENDESVKTFFKVMNSFPSFQFIELCTGERGPMYKGTKITKGSDKGHTCSTGSSCCATSLLTIDNYISDDVEGNGPLHYELSLCPKVEDTKCFKYQKIIEFFPNGGLQVYQVSHKDTYSFSNVVGIGVNKHTHKPLFNDGSTILDSGIAFQLC